MGDVAETILQNSISNIAKLRKLGLDYDLQSIRSELDGRQFMMFLRHSSNAINESRRRLLLLTYFEEPMTAIAIQASTLSDQPEIIESSSSLSLLKRQMSQISFDTEKDTKEPDA
ncbi:hypothetical protein LIER_19827 [Lithospermum erythrorhizon]|uniref:Uncharacterized protein n=1 Tax=Lithospermum erythrorhizon TaxID=34254 RepID=A0AAV3QJA5_LITER